MSMWLLGFEPRSPRPQRGILTTKLQPLGDKISQVDLVVIGLDEQTKDNAVFCYDEDGLDEKEPSDDKDVEDEYKDEDENQEREELE
ncbi:hypothetical protein ACET3Z_027155 [Daucus carota]